MDALLSALFVALLLQVVLFGTLCGWLAEQKGRDGLYWFILGAAFGLLSLLVLGFSPAVKKSKATKAHLDLSTRSDAGHHSSSKKAKAAWEK
jgi:MFS family permease